MKQPNQVMMDGCSIYFIATKLMIRNLGPLYRKTALTNSSSIKANYRFQDYSNIMSPPPVPPLSPYGTLQGSLFCYHNNLAAFESVAPTAASGDALPNKKCILIGGLSDGLMPTPYTQDLERECHKLGWSFVNPILSSSYLGFGNGALERDSQEIR